MNKSGSGFCKRCQKQVMTQKNGVNHVLHLILSIITAGGWLVVWGVLWLFNSLGGWRCSQCGNKV